MAAMTFAVGGIAYWMPKYAADCGLADPATANLLIGGLAALGGLAGTLAGGYCGDLLRDRLRGAYLKVSAAGMFLAWPFFLLMLFTPFPAAWVFYTLAVFLLFFNTGPANTVIANVTPPRLRATAFAVNIFVSHFLGDALSPPLVGAIADGTPENDLRPAFLLLSWTIILGGLLWFWGARHLEQDTERGARAL
jgi:sugar phosphate permease